MGVESCIAQALVQLKALPLCRHSYPALWEWTKRLCKEAFAGGGASPSPTPLLGTSDGGVEKMDVDVLSAAAGVVAWSRDRSCDHSDTPPQKQEEASVSGLQGQAYSSLLQLCLYGVAVCAVRYPAFYKPLYRLATTLHTMRLTQVGLLSFSLSLLYTPSSPAAQSLPTAGAIATSSHQMPGEAPASVCP